MKISIIVPVYNVEKYIDKCLSSLYDQQLGKDKYEIIVVNDGTPDNSIEVVNKYIQCYNNIRLVNQNNSGVSFARNVGIKNATGDFVIFVDPDDWIFANSLDILYDFLINNGDVEVLFLRSFSSNGKNEKYPWVNWLDENKYYTGKQVYDLGYLRGSVCGGVYKRSFLISNEIEFPLKIRNGEDSIFIILVMMYVKKMAFLNTKLYSVYERENSASRSLDLERIYGFKTNIDYLLDVLNKVRDDAFKTELIRFELYIVVSSVVTHYIRSGYNRYRDLYDRLDLARIIPICVSNKSVIRRGLWVLNHSYIIFCILKKIQYNIYE